MRFLVTFLCVLVSISKPTSGQSQNLTYDVVMFGKSIGSVKTSKVETDSLLHYSINSKVSINILYKINIDFSSKSTYKNGFMIKAFTKNYTNDKLNTSSEINWDGQRYKVELEEETFVLEPPKIFYSASALYYQEPKNIKSVFSERFAKYLPIKAVGPHKYELSLPDGKKNYFSYQNGICTEVEVNQKLATLYFKLK